MKIFVSRALAIQFNSFNIFKELRHVIQQEISSMSLEDQIAGYSAKVSTDSYSMSVSELSSMYKDNELDLHPEFQRFFRWTIEQKSKLVESLLLGIPIPPVFVSERPNSRWDVIDGLQRLSTIFELMGYLRDEENQKKEKLQLVRTRYLPSLEGKQWESDDSENRLPDSAKIKIKRARIDINIVKNTSDDIAKYEIFQRLNTGGSIATDQEVRSCILIMNNRGFFRWMKRVSEYANFQSCILLTDRAMDEAFDLELVTRFTVFSTSSYDKLTRIEELGDFLTDEIVSKANDPDFNYDEIEEIFKQAFDYLSQHLEQDSFRKFNSSKNRYYGASLVSVFEVIAVGIGRKLLEGSSLPNPDIFLEKHKELGSNESLRQFTKSGVRSSTRIPKTIQFGESLFDQCV